MDIENKRIPKLEILNNKSRRITFKDSEIEYLTIESNDLFDLDFKNCDIHTLKIITQNQELFISSDNKINNLIFTKKIADGLKLDFDNISVNKLSLPRKIDFVKTSHESYLKNKDLIGNIVTNLYIICNDENVFIDSFDSNKTYLLTQDKHNINYCSEFEESWRELVVKSKKKTKLTGEILHSEVSFSGDIDFEEINIENVLYINILKRKIDIPKDHYDKIVLCEDYYEDLDRFNLNFLNCFKLGKVTSTKLIRTINLDHFNGKISAISEMIYLQKSNLDDINIITDHLKTDFESLNNIKNITRLKTSEITLINGKDNACNNPLLKNFCRQWNIPFLEDNKLSKIL